MSSLERLCFFFQPGLPLAGQWCSAFVLVCVEKVLEASGQALNRISKPSLPGFVAWDLFLPVVEVLNVRRNGV